MFIHFETTNETREKNILPGRPINWEGKKKKNI